MILKGKNRNVQEAVGGVGAVNRAVRKLGYWNVSNVMGRAVQEAVYWNVSNAVYWNVSNAVDRAVNNVMPRADAVDGAIYWAVLTDPKHPALQDFL